MIKSSSSIIAALTLALLGSITASGQDTVVVAVPAKAGPVEGRTENSDAFIWRLFTDQIASPAFSSRPSPVKFETWASDSDTFSPTPRWPDPNAPKKLHASVLELVKTLPASGIEALNGLIDVECKPPKGAAVGGFPTSGTRKLLRKRRGY
jgi:hypothetical protein